MIQRVFFATLFNFILLSISIGSLQASISQWNGPDFIENETCIENGPAKVCIYNHNQTKPFIKIIYNGYLTKNGDTVKTWIKLNGQDDQFEMTKTNEMFEVSINKYQNVYICSKRQQISEEYPTCPGNFPESENGQVTWSFDPPTAKDQKLFSKIGLTPKFINIELAFTSSNKWDSDYGRNFHYEFHF